jgi:hypothetical protein
MFNHHRYAILAVALLLLLMSSGCGAAGGAISTPVEALPLTRPFFSEDGTIAFQYPEDWYAMVVSGQITVANNQMAAETSLPTSGQFVARMFVGRIDAVGGLESGASPLSAVQLFAQSVGDIQFGAAQELVIGTSPAARIDGTGPDGQAVIIAADMGNGIYNVVSGLSAAGELGRYDATLLAIIASVNYVGAANPGG